MFSWRVKCLTTRSFREGEKKRRVSNHWDITEENFPEQREGVTHETVPSRGEAARGGEHAETQPEELGASGRGSTRKLQEEKTGSPVRI